MAVRLAPISDADRPRVGAFLQANLNARVDADSWAAVLDVPWSIEQPNGGFMLLDGDEVVGAHLAFYSEREIDGRIEQFCNLGAWCVLETHRFHSLRLLKALLAQDGYHFTDLSPSGNVIKLNQRLRFEALDTSSALVPNLPWPTLPGRRRVVTDPAEIESTLTGDALRIYRDHIGAAAALHVVLRDGDDWCYVVYRRDRRKNLPLFASLLYVSHPPLFRRLARHFHRHLLFRHGIAATLVEHRIAGEAARPSFRIAKPRHKMFRSPHLQASQIDYLYSELVCVAW
jgi:hypothetical protein